MKILFIAFEFPPLSSAGVHRSLKFTKYLPDFGIQPVVVTLDGDSAQQIWQRPLDNSPLHELPKDIEIERIPCSPIPQHFLPGKMGRWCQVFFSRFDDGAKHWHARLAAALPRLISKHHPQAILATVPPFAVAASSCKFAKRLRLPVLLDFRDAWSQWRVAPYRSWVHYELTLRLEKKCLSEADKVICTSEQTRLDFLRIHPELPEGKIEVIMNGYDEEVGDWNPRVQDGGKHFRIGYVGSFYYDPIARESMMRPWWRKRSYRMLQYVPRKEDWLYRSPYFFFQAVARLVEKYPECGERLRICFAGRKPDWVDAQVNYFGIGALVEFVGHLDHPSVVKFQQRCDALLVTSSKVIGGRDYSIASKTFDYFTMRKPILGFVTEGAQRDLLAASGLALLCDPDAADESAETIRNLMAGRVRLEPNIPLMKRLHRRNLTRRLAEIILEVTERSTAA